jgi:hypothetical protein
MDSALPDQLSDLLTSASGPGATWGTIEHDDVAAVSFRAHRVEIREALEKFEITCVDLMQVTYRGQPHPVLLIGIDHSSTQKSALEAVISSSGWEELLQAKIYVQHVKAILHRPLKRIISLGQALSVVDWPESQGTYGGPILLGGEYYALTCHHVVYNSAVYPELKEIPDGEREKSIYVPSRRKWELFLEKAQGEIKAAQKRLQIHYKDVADGVYAGKTPQELEKIENECRLSVEMAEASLAEEPFEKWRIGRVAYDCGALTTAGWKGNRRTVDWALVRLGKSVLPRATVELPTGREVSLGGLYPDQECDYTALRMEVHKTGQKTLLTVGRINGVRSDVKMFRQSPSLLTEELMVASKERGPPFSAFSAPGDSGAWVMCGSDVIGMVLGGTDEEPYRTYIADMRQVFEHIHRVTMLVPRVVNDESSKVAIAGSAVEHIVILHHCLFSPATPKVKFLSTGRGVVFEQVETLEVRLSVQPQEKQHMY